MKYILNKIKIIYRIVTCPYWIIRDLTQPWKAYGILACKDTGIRGNCYTVLKSQAPWLLSIGIAEPCGMVYEKDEDGNPTKDFDKIIIL